MSRHGLHFGTGHGLHFILFERSEERFSVVDASVPDGDCCVGGGSSEAVGFSIPGEVSLVACLPGSASFGEVQVRGHLLRPCSAGGLVAPCGRVHLERFVGADVVVCPAELPLPSESLLPFEGSKEALDLALGLGVAGPAMQGLHAQQKQLQVEAGEPGRGIAPEGRAVVAEHGLGQSELAEGLPEQRPPVGELLAADRLQQDAEAGGVVHASEHLRLPARDPLEVHLPELVRRIPLEAPHRAGSGRRTGQPGRLEDPVDGARRRQAVLQQGQLASAPERMLRLQGQNPLHHRIRSPRRTRMGTTRGVQKTGALAVLEALQPLVARRTRNPELKARRPNARTIHEHSRHEHHPTIQQPTRQKGTRHVNHVLSQNANNLLSLNIRGEAR